MSGSIDFWDSPRLSNSFIISSLKAIIGKGQGLSKTQKRISIGAAVFATVSYFLYKRISTPPKHLRHIPHVNYFQMMKAFFTGESLPDIIQRVVNPVVNSRGLYLRPSRGNWNIYVTDPELAKVVYNKAELFPKLDLTKINEGTYNGKFVVRSNNLFFAVGDEWKRQRRIANPAFHRAMPLKLFGNHAERLFDSIANNSSASVGKSDEVDMGDFIKRYALDVIGSAGFDFDFDSLRDPKAEYAERYEKVMDAVIDPLFFFFPNLERHHLWMFPKRVEIHNELEVFLDMMRAIIVKKRKTLAKQKNLAAPNDHAIQNSLSRSTEKDILTLLIESANNEENSDLSIANDDMLLSNLCILFTAGHETTTAAILFLMYELAKNQDMQQKARDEILRVLGDDNSNTIPTAEQLTKFEYLNILIKEALRLHSPVPVSGPRVVTEDTYLGETFVPKGSIVVIDQISLHRNPKDWKSPDEFIPERFTSGGEVEGHAGFGTTYAPFGGGNRHCIGRNFALNEQKILLSMFLKKYTWKLPENSIHRNGLVTKGIFLLSPVDMRLIVEPRY